MSGNSSLFLYMNRLPTVTFQVNSIKVTATTQRQKELRVSDESHLRQLAAHFQASQERPSVQSKKTKLS